jgi:two-component system catabolic regulation response regulator CreB
LVVEDEPAIAESVAYSLKRAGHNAAVATSLRTARAALSPQTELLVLDLMLPDGSGFDWIEELEERRRSGLAISVLSSRDAEADRGRALEMGADDYVT